MKRVGEQALVAVSFVIMLNPGSATTGYQEANQSGPKAEVVSAECGEFKAAGETAQIWTGDGFLVLNKELVPTQALIQDDSLSLIFRGKDGGSFVMDWGREFATSEEEIQGFEEVKHWLSGKSDLEKLSWVIRIFSGSGKFQVMEDSRFRGFLVYREDVEGNDDLTVLSLNKDTKSIFTMKKASGDLVCNDMAVRKKPYEGSGENAEITDWEAKLAEVSRGFLRGEADVEEDLKELGFAVGWQQCVM